MQRGATGRRARGWAGWAAEERGTIEDVIEPCQIEIQDGSWQQTPSPDLETPFRGVRLWWHGDTASGIAAVAPEDEDLEEQLRALGYIQ